jgi:hypothetical protein
MTEFSTRLYDARRRFGVSAIAGALITDGNVEYSAKGSEQGGFTLDTLVPQFCLSKVLTATLIALAIEEDAFALDDSVTDFFSAAPMVESDGAARRVTVSQLLSHTHGWVSAPAPQSRRSSDGFIAPRTILKDLASRPRLFEPGGMYSYDNGGYLLLGAMLESVHRARFGEILQRRLIGPLGMSGASVGAIACPAEGEGIALSTRALCRLVQYHLSAQRPAANLARTVQTTPGWNPFYRGTTLAWRDLGDGWLSHEGVGFEGAPYSMVRLNRETGAALILASPDARARLLGLQIFSAIARSSPVTEFALPLSGAALAACDHNSLCGAYANGANQTFIYRGEGAQVRARFTIAGRAPTERTLQPATREVYFLQAPLGRRQFVQPLRSGGRITHLWDGYEIARRME